VRELENVALPLLSPQEIFLIDFPFPDGWAPSVVVVKAGPSPTAGIDEVYGLLSRF